MDAHSARSSDCGQIWHTHSSVVFRRYCAVFLATTSRALRRSKTASTRNLRDMRKAYTNSNIGRPAPLVWTARTASPDIDPCTYTSPTSSHSSPPGRMTIRHPPTIQHAHEVPRPHRCRTQPEVPLPRRTETGMGQYIGHGVGVSRRLAAVRQPLQPAHGRCDLLFCARRYLPFGAQQTGEHERGEVGPGGDERPHITSMLRFADTSWITQTRWNHGWSKSHLIGVQSLES